MANRRKFNLLGRSAPSRRTTTITFSEDDLVALGRLVRVGQAMLQTHAPVVARLKAAPARPGVPIPSGL